MRQPRKQMSTVQKRERERSNKTTKRTDNQMTVQDGEQQATDKKA